MSPLVHLYEEEGAGLVARLRGMFAFALWDRVRGRLVLARDRLGIKPLYIYRDADALIFGSELKAILAEGASTGVLESEEHAMIGRVLRLADKPVRALMTPDMFDRQALILGDIVVNGDKVLVETTFRVRGRSSGIELANRGWQVWTIRDDLAVRVELFDDEAAARAATGLAATPAPPE